MTWDPRSGFIAWIRLIRLAKPVSMKVMTRYLICTKYVDIIRVLARIFGRGIAVWAWHMSLAHERGMYVLSVQIFERKILTGLRSGLGCLL